ncbi:aldehyde oxidase GLOX1-like isoform X3 [Dioscorea cayenensis subsp. rotundata]|uniref:Aldehyde oxidase GLOX1-like isoform X3 n=1 Tax=Dioscorea cayennensis subsp. rotundata TaxID=55577 RepID=A0AB40AYR6_DIOCR|nr:aldehyde oxidase GLOX1-like isoform X3 [Dioscorea cayenensis subsp. rotundata]XP_039119477.1 aldehyde oxidase GLOX1-like isoform X3 [Dioscorea cayenensis subsp. rotundata]
MGREEKNDTLYVYQIEKHSSRDPSYKVYELDDVFCGALPQNGGKFKVLRRNIGISAMHVALLPNDKLIIFDRTDFGLSNISLPAGRCRDDLNEQAVKHDCSAHSIEFNPKTHSVRPLTVLTDTWCSSGVVSADGVLIQTGGFNDGDHSVRYFSPCDTCDWEEIKNGLILKRWYASNALLPDGRIIVVGGRARFDYEFIPKASVYDLPFLRQTKDSSENNLYPFLHLLPDGNLFVFANTKSIVLDFKTNKVVREFPEIPGNAARNYPSSGSSVLLPLLLNNSEDINGIKAEIMICGGAEPSSNSKAMKGEFLPADDTCGRLVVTEKSPEWEMERMPMSRVMGDMVLLPTGDILIINGAGKGTAGWCMGREPVLHPVLYSPENKMFKVMDPTTIPRLYHSTAHLLSDGRVMVGGSNPNIKYEFSGVLFPTELSLEAYSPPYLFRGGRPRIVMVEPGLELRHGQRITLGFKVERGGGDKEVKVTMVVPGFTTHSFTMNQRVLVLKVVAVNKISGESYAVDAFVPAAAVVAPPGYYLLHVVHGGVPSRGKWVKIK